MQIRGSACIPIVLLTGLLATASGLQAQEPIVTDVAGSRGIRPEIKSGHGIDYHGGPVMLGNIRIYYIWYGSWDAAAKSILVDFAKGIGDSTYFNIETTYSDARETAVSNSVSYGGDATDNYSLGM